MNPPLVRYSFEHRERLRLTNIKEMLFGTHYTSATTRA
jgi:hypothetical protein